MWAIGDIYTCDDNELQQSMFRYGGGVVLYNVWNRSGGILGLPPVLSSKYNYIFLGDLVRY